MADRVRASHILVNEETLAADLMSKVQAGAKFADLARAHSMCPSKRQGGDLGYFGKGEMVKEFEETAFALQPGQLGGPVKTEFGYHIILRTE